MRAARALTGYRLDNTGALEGDELLRDLMGLGFCVRRYGAQAGLDDETAGLGRVPPMPMLRQFMDRQAQYGTELTALRARDQAPGDDLGKEGGGEWLQAGHSSPLAALRGLSCGEVAKRLKAVPAAFPQARSVDLDVEEGER